MEASSVARSAELADGSISPADSQSTKQISAPPTVEEWLTGLGGLKEDEVARVRKQLLYDIQRDTDMITFHQRIIDQPGWGPMTQKDTEWYAKLRSSIEGWKTSLPESRRALTLFVSRSDAIISRLRYFS